MSDRTLTRTWAGLLRSAIPAVTCILCWNCTAAPSERPTPRGEMLYATHCIACHNVQIHWREKKLVTDWGSLQLQVGRWQETSGLGWGVMDIDEVSRYLNARYYHLPSAAQERTNER